MIFASAYKQLHASERTYVDAFVQAVEVQAARENTRIMNVLARGVPQSVIDAARGMLDKPLVQAAITERVREIADQNELALFRVLKEHQAIAFSSMANYMQIGEDGAPRFDLASCTPEQLSAIQSIEIEEAPQTGRRKFKLRLYDKQHSLDVFMRYMGALEPDNPYWAADNAKQVVHDKPRLPAGTTPQVAADIYSRMINNAA